MKILVTGGAGFIASHTNVELLNKCFVKYRHNLRKTVY